MTRQLHVIPCADVIGHESDEACVCGPAAKMVNSMHGDLWIYTHHMLQPARYPFHQGGDVRGRH